MAKPYDEPRLGTPEVITSFGGESNVLAASSVAGHPDAYAVFHRKIGANVYSVVHRDRSGHAHRFDLPTRSGTFPEAIRIVALEAGGGMAIWDDSRTGACARTRLAQRRPARRDPSRVVAGHDLHSADGDSAQWRVRADGRGTVVVATTGMSLHNVASVFAAVRDPGGRFRAQQELTPPEETGVAQRQLTISPISTDGTVGIAWGPEYGDGEGGAAVRSGRTASFGAAAARPFTAEAGLDAQHRSVNAADGTPVTVSRGWLARLCPCVRRGCSAGAAECGRLPSRSRAGRPASRPAAGTSHAPTRAASSTGPSRPPRMPRRCRYAERGQARSASPASTRAPTTTCFAGTPGSSSCRSAPRSRAHAAPRDCASGPLRGQTGRRLLVPVYCDRVCRVHGSAGVIGPLAVTDFAGKPIDARLEPFTVAYCA